MNPFLGKESDIVAAEARARRNATFWDMVYDGAGISYTELKNMDLAEFYEAVKAKEQFLSRRENS